MTGSVIISYTISISKSQCALQLLYIILQAAVESDQGWLATAVERPHPEDGLHELG